VAVYLKGNPAKPYDAFWLGGPDFAVEIVSPGDRTRKKLPFYASVGTRELLAIERKPWKLELFRLRRGKLVSVGESNVKDGTVLASEVIPFTFRLMRGGERPRIEVTHTADGRSRKV
jgi:Uma2 family endonuclease